MDTPWKSRVLQDYDLKHQMNCNVTNENFLLRCIRAGYERNFGSDDKTVGVFGINACCKIHDCILSFIIQNLSDNIYK